MAVAAAEEERKRPGLDFALRRREACVEQPETVGEREAIRGQS